jgi:CDP-L-myo-inositol myo-inositolphosphotransferase
MATNLMFVLGLTIGLGRLRGMTYWAVGGGGFLVFFLGVAIMAVLVRRAPGGGTFDLLKILYSRRYTGGPMAALVATMKTVMSRDFFAFAFAVLAVTGLSWVIPWAFAAAAVIWLGAILLAAPAVLMPARPSQASPASGEALAVVADERSEASPRRTATLAS